MTNLPYPLDLGDGREPIMCRDAHQASLLLGIWRACHVGVQAPVLDSATTASEGVEGFHTRHTFDSSR
jgi:hypothetical protein